MNAIEVRNVSKLFRKKMESYRSIKEDLALWTANLLRGKNSDSGDHMWAVRDVSFRLKGGETIGLIGSNGSGKTTMLRLIAGITKPTSGEIKVVGEMSTLIDLLAGFHADLTGRENIFINGVVLGMDNKEIREKFDAIVEFSGLKDFLDTPFKRYSTGMMVRLGFAMDTIVEPDIFVVDEILAVGDQAFQDKCHRRIKDMLSKGCTLVMASHDMSSIKSLCQRAIWMEKGEVVADGDSEYVVKKYQEGQKA